MPQFILDVPVPDLYTAIGLGLSGIGTLLAIFSSIVSYRKGRSVLQYALSRFRDKIVDRISHRSPEKDLLSINSIKSLAMAIQIEMHSPVITEYMIAEAIRLAALDLEDRFKGVSLKRRLIMLDGALREFDPVGPRLACVAARDRMYSYLTALILVSLIPFWSLILLWMRYPAGSLIYAAIALILEIIIIILNVRAHSYWSAHKRQVHHSSLGIADPTSPIDVFIYISQSHNVLLGVFWEPLLMISTLILFNPVVLSLIYKAISFLPLNLDSCRQILNNFVSIAFYLTAILFWLISHKFRYIKVWWLSNRLDAAMCNIKMIELGHKKRCDTPNSNAPAYCRRLWAITGSPYYREILRQLSTKSEDEVI